MALGTFPVTGTTPNDNRNIRGSGRLYYGTYASAGAEASAFVYLGQMAEGGLDIADEFEYVEVNGEEQLGPSDADVSGHVHKWTTTLVEAPIGLVNLVCHGAAANVVVNGTTSKYSAIGGYYASPSLVGSNDPRVTFYQLVVESPSENAGAGQKMGYHQIYKGRLKKAGAQKIARKNIGTIPVDIQAFWDWSLTPAAGGPGRYGKKWVQYVA